MHADFPVPEERGTAMSAGRHRRCRPWNRGLIWAVSPKQAPVRLSAVCRVTSHGGSQKNDKGQEGCCKRKDKAENSPSCASASPGAARRRLQGLCQLPAPLFSWPLIFAARLLRRDSLLPWTVRWESWTLLLWQPQARRSLLSSQQWPRLSAFFKAGRGSADRRPIGGSLTLALLCRRTQVPS